MNIEYFYGATILLQFGEMEFELPCSETVLRDRLREMGVDDPDNFTVCIDKVVYPEVMRTLENKKINLDEMNYLAKILDSLCEQEYYQFDAAAEHYRADDMKMLINIAFNLQRYTFIPNGATAEEAGDIHIMTRDICIPVSEYKQMDFAKIGSELLSSGKGIKVECGTLFINEDIDFEEVYDGQVFPPFCFHDCFIVAKISYGGKYEMLFLPEDDLAIDRAVKRLGANDLSECTIVLDKGISDRDIPLDKFKEILAKDGLYAVNEYAEIMRYSIPEQQPYDLKI